jgi:hypothetical protein
MAQIVMQLPLDANDRIRTQVSPCRIDIDAIEFIRGILLSSVAIITLMLNIHITSRIT